MSTFNTEDRITMSDLAQSLRDAIDAKAENTDLTDHTGDLDIHVTTTDKDKWNSAKSIADEVVDFNVITGATNRVKVYVDKLIGVVTDKLVEIDNKLTDAFDIIYSHTNRLDMAEFNIKYNASNITDINSDLELRTKQVTIMKGILNLGDTIPLPSGFTEDQCKWFVTFKKVYNPNADKANFQIDDSTRVVTVTYEWYNATTSTIITENILPSHILYGTTSLTYVIIGVKIGSDT